MIEKPVDFLEGKEGALSEAEVKDLLKSYGIKTTSYEVVEAESDLEDIELDFPVALKVCSSDILHKTDVGGVELGIKDMEELKNKFDDFKEKFPDKKFLVDQMEEKNVEAIVGLTRDPTFGLTIMCGVGGIYTELYQDVSFRVVPIDGHSAWQMIEELKGKKLLEGFRDFKAGKKPMVDLLLKVSDIGEDLMSYVDQMDLNPVFVYEDEVCVVDAKLILKNNEE